MAGIIVSGDTSGAVTLQAPAVAGTVTVTLPATTGTMLTTASTTGVSGNAISAGTVAEAYGGTGTTTGYYGFKNRIINGAMVIDQRNAGASVSATAGGQYFLDRWSCGISAGSKFTVQQSSTAPAGFNQSSLITSSTAWTVGASDNATYYQYIEGYNIADLGFGSASASTVTLSFWVRSSLTGTFGGILSNTSTRFYPFTYTINAANTFEQKTITIAGDTSGTWLTTTGMGLQVAFSLAAGSSKVGTAGAWTGAATYQGATGQTNILATNGATWYVTGVQLEKGSTATSFDYRPIGTELALCQRYYEKSFEIGTAPASAGSAAGAFEFAQQVAASAQQYGPSCKYAVVKRSTPTATFYNWNAAGNQAVNIVTGGNTTSLALRAGQSGTSSFSITFIAPAGTSVGQGLSVQWTADSEL